MAGGVHEMYDNYYGSGSRAFEIVNNDQWKRKW